MKYKTILTEAVITDDSINMDEVSRDQTAKWHLESWGDSLAGQQVTENGKVASVSLKEDYSHSSYPLMVARRTDGCTIGWGGTTARTK